MFEELIKFSAVAVVMFAIFSIGVIVLQNTSGGAGIAIPALQFNPL